MTRKYSVYGIGNAIMDLQYEVTDEELKRLGLAKSHMQLVDLAQQQKLIENFSKVKVNQASGGSAANTIIAIAQLGGAVAYGCLVGDDKYGREYLAEMGDLKVATHARPSNNGVTGTCVVLISPDAERTMNTHLGISAEFSAENISAEYIKASEWIFIEGYLFSTAAGRAAIETAVACAKEGKTKIAVTFSDGFIVSGFREPLEKCVREASLIFANVNEALTFTAESNEERAFKKLCDTVPNVVMTRSERGALVKFGDKVSDIPPVPTKAVDDTGAGDVFAGGFLFGITHGMDGEVAGKLGCLLGSKVVSQFGARLIGDPRSIAEESGIRLSV